MIVPDHDVSHCKSGVWCKTIKNMVLHATTFAIKTIKTDCFNSLCHISESNSQNQNARA